MFIFQLSNSARKTESSNVAARRTVSGWFSALRGRFMSVAKKLF